jgi:hypothetical protein
MIAYPQPLMSPQEYLEWEATQPIKYEYFYDRVTEAAVWLIPVLVDWNLFGFKF